MIARLWRGWTKTSDAAANAHALEEALETLTAAPGNHGVIVLSRSTSEHTEVVVVALWESENAARGSGGDEVVRLIGDRTTAEPPDRDLAVADYEVHIRGDLALGASIFFEE